MKRFRSFMQKEPLVLPAALLIFGLLAGHIAFRVIRAAAPDAIIRWNTYYIDTVQAFQYEGVRLFRVIFMGLAREATIFFMLCLTILGVPYYSYCILKKGFQISFLVSCFLYIYASKGIFMAFCIYFPQMLCYLPASFFCIKYGWNLYTDVQCQRVKPSFRNNPLMKQYIKWFMRILLLFAAGAALEAFVGQYIWNWAAGTIA